MDVSQKIMVQPWMLLPQTRAVMAALDGGGGRQAESSPQALFVGGCVRNTLLDVPVSDIDIATVWRPDDVMTRLNKAGIKAIPTGLDHGTITAVVDGQPFEITTLRHDVETFGRHAVVAFTTDWRDDAQRRDFTMNTLLADVQGHVYDPTGQGLDDLAARKVLFVGDPAVRIAEDYLRILRFFRFHACYGSGAPDVSALKACRDAAPNIIDLSRERITQEMFKILSGDNPECILKIMFENNILKDMLRPSSEFLDVLSILARLTVDQNKYDAFCIVARIFVFQSVSKGALKSVTSLLLLSNKQKKELKALVEVLSALEKGTGERPIKICLYHHGRHLTMQGLFLCTAQRGTEENLDDFTALIKDWPVPSFPLSGADIMDSGIPQGPQVGKILSAVEQWWIENDFQPDHDACLSKMAGLS